MKKSILLFVFVCLVNLFIGSSIFAQTPQPTGTTTYYYYYYCIGELASPLSVGGSNLSWYTAANGGTGSSTAPTPSTASPGATTYYVTQTIAGLESTPRKAITVNVNKQFSLFCAGTTSNSVSFDFANVGQSQFDYSYTVDGVGPITGSQTAPSSFSVNALLEGQTVVFTITAVGAPSCVSNRTLTASCATRCTSHFDATFNPIGPLCASDPLPSLPTSSLEGYLGTWSPLMVDNIATKTYTFTPTNKCVNSQIMTITVNPDSPGFSDFTICSGSSVPNLDTTSPNGVIGTWSPAAVDNLNSDSYTFTPDAGQCAAPQTIDVTVIPSNTLVDFSWTVTEAFADNQKISIAASAPGGDYLYKLDDGSFQSNAVFEYVASGLHSVTVIDQAGCSMPITKSDILVVNYPKYFTPNNDGFNDYWNISELSTQPYAYIRIFDRYGKFLKQISPNGSGWNGIYNGHFMPADDYWFVIHYLENNVAKEFKSHFSLKR
jgi:gliding motility-associated-like protein